MGALTVAGISTGYFGDVKLFAKFEEENNFNHTLWKKFCVFPFFLKKYFFGEFIVKDWEERKKFCSSKQGFLEG